ncbi:uncharacterized protein LOC116405026 [Cucumis sativus]|uniref:uncharacterized protein LOC116405026 n=1 Tax=Cucumis sativus TaxID=3659 RepID=UPI0012F4D82E|nr:uncharacterized protein LOC116405026 [Cucumis sativus]
MNSTMSKNIHSCSPSPSQTLSLLLCFHLSRFQSRSIEVLLLSLLSSSISPSFNFSLHSIVRLSFGLSFLQLPNSSSYGKSSKFDTHNYEDNDVGSINEMIEVAHKEYSKDPNEFEKLLIDAEKPLFEGCKKFTKLSTLVKLYNLKVRYG